LTAIHRLRSEALLDVTVIEPRPVLGAGVASATDEPAHLLYVRASGMSAFSCLPDHFADRATARRFATSPSDLVTRAQTAGTSASRRTSRPSARRASTSSTRPP
jgi:uncharacterized NAD(P)/FAD-binding protein YdhS